MKVGAPRTRREIAPSARLGWALFALGLLAFGVVLALRPLADADLGWHLAQGRVIVATGGIPAVDPLAYTHRPLQRVDLVGDVLLHLIDRAGGALGLQLWGAATALALAGVLLVLVRRATPLAPLVVALSLAAMASWLQVRPVLLSFLYLPVLLLLLDTHRRAPRTRLGRWSLRLVPPLLFLWSNTHGFVVLGVAVALAWAGSAVVARLARGRLGALFPVRDGYAAPAAALWVGLGVAAALVVPGGLKIFLGPARALDDVQIVTEWAKTGLGFLAGEEQAAGIVLVLTALALAFGREPSGRRLPSAFDLGLVALALVLGRSALRFVPVAVLLVAPFWGRRLARAVPKTPLMRVAAGFSALLVAPALLLRPGAELGVGFDRRFQPEGAVEYILAARPRGRMWNFSPYGGYLAYRLHPDHEVLVDGRTAWVHDPALTARAHASNFDPRAFAGLCAEHGIEWAVSRAGPEERAGIPLTVAPGWVMVHVDDYSAVYVRREGPNRALAEAGYRVLHHLVPVERVLAMTLSPEAELAALVHDAELAVRQDPKSARAAALRAVVALRAPDAELEAALRRLAALSPGHPILDALVKIRAELAARRP